uniref:Uncharacterized protein n=1 Tax=Ditylenchus dipsaci TaxID=166011 RepID=A0A915D2F8_9BILA
MIQSTSRTFRATEGCLKDLQGLLSYFAKLCRNARRCYPPFSVVSGNPAKIVGEWPPSAMQLMIDATTSFYANYLPKDVKK